MIFVNCDVNYLIARDVFEECGCCSDGDFYKTCMESISNKLGVSGAGSIPDKVYMVWKIIEEEYLS